MSPPARPKKVPSDLPYISRRFGRIPCNCAAIVSFPSRQAHPRVKGKLIQISSGGCAVTTDQRLFIGEECLVWATGGGHKYLGAQGRVVWMKTIYEGKEMTVVGIEFLKRVELTDQLLEHLGARPDEETPADLIGRLDDSEE